MKIKAQIIPEKDLPNYCLFLRQARLSKKLKQADMAKKIGISPMGFSHFELGRRVPRVTLFEKWLDTLGLEMKIDYK